MMKDEVPKGNFTKEIPLLITKPWPQWHSTRAYQGNIWEEKRDEIYRIKGFSSQKKWVGGKKEERENDKE